MLNFIVYLSTGLWEVPFNAHYVESYEGGHCPYLDQCVLHNHDADDVSMMYLNNYIDRKTSVLLC